MGRQLQRALWLARIATVALGLVVVVALLHLQQQRSLGLADEPPGAARLGAEFRGAGPELPDGLRAALEDGEGLEDGAEDGDADGEQRVAFSLSRIASLLGWGAAERDDDYSPEVADPDRIRLADMKPLSSLAAAKAAAAQDADDDWANSALLKAFMARFGAPRATAQPRGPADLADGELRDLDATPSAKPDPRPPSTTLTTAPADAPTSTPPPPLPLLPACPLNGVITTTTSASSTSSTTTGARVLEYAAAWLLSRAVGTGWRTPLVPAAVLRDLSALFARPSLAAVEQLPPACALDAGYLRGNSSAALAEGDLVDVKALPARFLDPSEPLVVRSGVLLPQLLAAHLPALRRELVFKGELVLAARAVLDVCRQRVHGEHGVDQGREDGADAAAAAVRYVAVHARRADIAPWIRGRRRRRPLAAEYFRAAMDHFRDAKQAVVFVVATDDPRWVADNLGSELCLTGPASPVDVAVLAACDAAVLDLGDTALATALLAAEQVVAPRALRAAEPGLAALPGWTFV